MRRGGAFTPISCLGCIPRLHCSAKPEEKWNRGLPRVKYNLLTPLKLQGGAGLPYFALYYKATNMARIVEWFPRPFLKALISIEKDLAPVDLRALL